jgi:hypothetical protein
MGLTASSSDIGKINGAGFPVRETQTINRFRGSKNHFFDAEL